MAVRHWSVLLDGLSEPDRPCVRPTIRSKLADRNQEGTMIFGQSSSTPLSQRVNVIMTRWHGLIQTARNPYRPELHYMRGPGPKWHAKHQRRIENGLL